MALKMKALSALTLKELESRRWAREMPETANWYYDEPIKDVTKRISKFPPDNLELSDAWVTAIIRSTTISRDDRGKRWPDVFTSKGHLRATFVYKGQSAKLCDAETKNMRYALLEGQYNMIGSEVIAEGQPPKRPTPLKGVDVVSHRLIAQNQDMNYTVPAESTDSPKTAPKSTKGKANAESAAKTTRVELPVSKHRPMKTMTKTRTTMDLMKWDPEISSLGWITAAWRHRRASESQE